MKPDPNPVLKKLLLLFLVVAAAYYAKAFFIPLAIGAVLATLFLPVCKWLEKRRIPRGLAAFVCMLLLLPFIAGVGALLGWQLSELTKDIPLIKQNIGEAISRSQEFIFKRLGITLAKQSQLMEEQQTIFKGVIPGLAGSLVVMFTQFILVMAYIVLFLYYRVHIRQFLIKVASTAQRSEMEQVIDSAAHVSQQYLVGLAKMIGCLWIMYSIGFALVGVKNAIIFAILCGLLEIVPFIGNITGTTLTIVVAAAQGASLPMLAGIAGTYGLVQFIQGWVIEPVILGPQVKINPLFTIIALVVGELIWGIPGIFLAIPLIAMFKIVCDHIEPLKPYGFLIGEVSSGKKQRPVIKKLRKIYKAG